MGGLLETRTAALRTRRHRIGGGLAVAMGFALGLISPAGAAPAAPDSARALAGTSRAREIVDRVDRLLRGESSRGELEMQIVTQHWQRTLRLRVWSLGTKARAGPGGGAAP
jgi:hypothetical protein